MKITVYTVILNGFDNLQSPAVVEPGVRYVCFANTPQPAAPPWEIIPLHPMPLASMARNSRLPKILPHLFVDESEYTIYHDGSFVMKTTPSALIEQYLQSADIAIHRHPGRKCVYDEAQLCLKEGIGDAAQLQQQLKRYESLNWPRGAGLYAAGVLLRRQTPAVARFNEIWWEEFRTQSTRDQLSLPIALHVAGLTSARMPGNIFSSPHFGYVWHAAFLDRGNNPAFAGWRAEQADRERGVLELCQ